MNSGAMLNAYPDSLGSNLHAAAALLNRPELRGAFRSFYVLPSLFNTDLDRGFSVISYDLNRRLTSVEDLEQLRRAGLDLKLDFILNHLSVLSPQFQDVLRQGDASPYRDFFIDWNCFWAGRGQMTEDGYIQPDAVLLKDMFFRKPGLPILMVRLPDGRNVPYWNTFYQEVRYDPVDAQDLMRGMDIQYGEAEVLSGIVNRALAEGMKPADMNLGEFVSYRAQMIDLMEGRRKYLGQMDLNLRSPLVWAYYEDTLLRLADYGAEIVRLDAFAYTAKTPGLRNFLNEPDTWDVLERLRVMAEAHHLTLLPEIHASYAEGSYRTLADKGYMIYDFFLPGLLIDALENGDGTSLVSWAREIVDKKLRVVNMLGCHDGIPMLDLKGLIPEERIQRLINLIVSRGGLIKNLHEQKNVYYQVNATYYSALGEDDRKLLLARAIQLFMPGKPQVWYLDLFAGRNDLAAAEKGRAAGHKEINRANLDASAIERALTLPVVQSQLKLLRLRSECAAFGFDNECAIQLLDKNILCIVWRKDGVRAELRADLRTCAFFVYANLPEGEFRFEQAE